MARRKKKIKRVSKFRAKFFKYLTIFGASFGVLASSTFAVVMGINATNGDFITDEVREYTASFKSEDTVISSKVYKRGDILESPEAPVHSIDGEYNYFFVGWDLTGNGIPDFVPPRVYADINANAVYIQTGKFDLSFLDLANMDLEQLLELMDKLNIDWEQFMDMFGLDLEQLMSLLNKPVVTFTADASPFIAYFRASSLGNFNYKTKQFGAPDFYDTKDLVSDNSINPLSYTADLLENIYSMYPEMLDPEFDFVTYNNFTFESNVINDYFPVPDCELVNNNTEYMDSDAHYIKYGDNGFETKAAYVPAVKDVISILSSAASFVRSGAVKRDERAYQKYAEEHYTTVPVEYQDIINDIIKTKGWQPEDYSQVDSIAAYVSSMGTCSLFSDTGEIDITGYNKNNDPVNGLIENGSGTDFDFNTVAVMIFRSLDIPARMVKGYLVPNIQQGENTVTMLEQHYWCEIYVDTVGWMICDCMNFEQILGYNPYGDLDKDSNPIKDEKELQRIEVTGPTKTTYHPGDNIVTSGMSVTAYLADGSEVEVPLEDCVFSKRAPTTLGEHEITVSYTRKSITKTDTFTINVIERDANVDTVTFEVGDVKKQFFIGDSFETDGLYALVHYDNDTTERIEISEITIDSSKVDLSKKGTYTVNLTTEYDGETYRGSYTVTVWDEDVVRVIIDDYPDQLWCYANDTFDTTGLKVQYELLYGDIVDAEDGTYTISGINESDLKEPELEHEVTITHTRPRDGEKITESFNIEIRENNMIGIDVKYYNDVYRVGDYFDLADCLSGSTVFANYEHTGLKAFKNTNTWQSLEPISYPSFSSVGATYLTVRYKNEKNVSFDKDLPITVVEIDPYTFATSAAVTTAGPGYGMTPGDLFKIDTTYVGTMYFNYRTYATYGTAGWSNEIKNASDYYTYDKTTQYFNTNQVSIEYLRDMDSNVIPSYSNSTAKSAVTSGQVSNYQFSAFDLNRASDYGYYYYEQITNNDYFTFSTSLNSGYSSYRNTLYNRTTSQYLAKSSNSDLNNAIQDYIASLGNYYISYSQYNSKSDTLMTINNVKNDLRNHFNCSIDFSYESYVDPVCSFFNSYLYSGIGKGQGIATTFASAATLIYRQLGYPARYVTGFGVYSAGGETTVTTNKAHAWTEVWLDDLGWVIVDPLGFDDGHTNDGSATGNDYGQGFGGSATNGIYNTSKRVEEFTVEVTGYKYDSNIFEEDGGEYFATYDAQSHDQFIQPQYKVINKPSYLNVNVTLEVKKDTTSDDGYKIGSFWYVPKVTIFDNISHRNVNNDHIVHITGAGKDGAKYYVERRYVQLEVNPNKSSYSPGESVSFYVSIKNSTYAGDDYANFELTEPVSYAYIGDGYKDYNTKGNVVIRNMYGNDVTNCYRTKISYKAVVVK